MGIISDPDSDPETDLSACEHAQADKLQQQQFPRIWSSENRVMCQNFPAGRHELEKLQKT